MHDDPASGWGGDDSDDSGGLGCLILRRNQTGT